MRLKEKSIHLFIVLIIMLFLFSITSFTQDNSTENDVFQNLGLEIGGGFFAFTGGGFLVKYWFNPSMAIGFSILPNIDLNSSNININFGTEFDYRIKIYDRVSPYLYLGFTGIYESAYNSLTYNIGIGFGIQWLILKNLDIQLHLGFGMVEGSNFVFGGGIGLFFAF